MVRESNVWELKRFDPWNNRHNQWGVRVRKGEGVGRPFEGSGNKGVVKEGVEAGRGRSGNLWIERDMDEREAKCEEMERLQVVGDEGVRQETVAVAAFAAAVEQEGREKEEELLIL